MPFGPFILEAPFVHAPRTAGIFFAWHYGHTTAKRCSRVVDLSVFCRVETRIFEEGDCGP